VAHACWAFADPAARLPAVAASENLSRSRRFMVRLLEDEKQTEFRFGEQLEY
jgi:hypothetical protein